MCQGGAEEEAALQLTRGNEEHQAGARQRPVRHSGGKNGRDAYKMDKRSRERQSGARQGELGLSYKLLS